MSDKAQGIREHIAAAKNTSRPEQLLGQSELAAPGLLERAIVELIARRGEAETRALECNRAHREQDCKEWLCRAAGIAEAIAVLQLLSNAARSNAEVSDSRE